MQTFLLQLFRATSRFRCAASRCGFSPYKISRRTVRSCEHYKDYTSLKETSYGANGLRAVLLQKNAAAVNQVRALKQQKLDLKITDDEYKKKVSEIKSGKDTPTVIIKATDDASYMNLIDALDEMQICNIGKYVITDIAEADEFLIKNYDAKGELSQNLADK